VDKKLKKILTIMNIRRKAFISKKQPYHIYIVLWLFIGGFSSNALAHKVNVFAWVEGDMICTESKFSGGGKRVKQAPIEVYDESGAKILEGKTNDQGEFSFKIPKQSTLKIVLQAGMGHQADWTIPIEEIIAAEETLQSLSVGTSKKISDRKEGGTSKDFKLPLKPQAIKIFQQKADNLAMLQEAFEKALDRKLKPLEKIISTLTEERHTIKEVFSGIGYILGLVGVAVYFKCKG
jgi:nickel transport protein